MGKRKSALLASILLLVAGASDQIDGDIDEVRLIVEYPLSVL